MEPFEPKPDFEYPIKKPSFDSVVRQKRREAEQKAEQERYKVANLQVPEDPENEPLYTEMEQKMMDEARELSLVGHLSELRKRLILMAVAIIVGDVYFLLLCRRIIRNTPQACGQALLYETY
nr:twin-arginine translocase subunit TatC [Veillonella rogosae]